MCPVCGFVIATLYLPKPKTQAIEALHAAEGRSAQFMAADAGEHQRTARATASLRAPARDA